MNQYQYEVGDIVKLKKQHPCGSHEWEILRVGAEVKQLNQIDENRIHEGTQLVIPYYSAEYL